jgi:serine/threonine protein kinase
LKLDNILIEKRHDGGLIARVIDFDSSYIAKEPPSSDDILGDPPYYSPELLDYIQGRIDGVNLGVTSDIFSLGIVFTQYLTGEKPTWTGDHNYLSEAVRADETISIPAIPTADGRDLELIAMLRSMIDKSPASRPGLMGIKTRLSALRDATGGISIIRTSPDGPDGPPTSPPPTPPTSGGAYSGITLEIAELVEQVRKSVEPAPKPKSGLRGTMVTPVADDSSSSKSNELLTSIRDQLKSFLAAPFE